MSMRAMIHDFAADVRLALRRLRRQPLLTMTTLLTIGLGLGIVAAIFTVYRAALLDTLPFEQPDRLVRVTERSDRNGGSIPTSYPTFLDLKHGATDLALEGYDPANFTVRGADDAMMLRGARVSSGFLSVLGIRLVAGRHFLPAEEGVVPSSVAIVSSRLAERTGSTTSRTILINDVPHTIVGVLPPSFSFASLQDADILTPFSVPEDARADRTARFIRMIARLPEGMSIDTAAAELRATMSNSRMTNGDTEPGTVIMTPLRDALLGRSKLVVESLTVAALLLFATMLTNLILLSSARHVRRSSELATRSALGATRARILRQLVAENVVIAAGGFAMALVVASIAMERLFATIPSDILIGMPYLEGVRIDLATVVALASAATILAIALGVGPSLLSRSAGPDLTTTRTTAGPRGRRFRSILIVAQLSFSIVLLVAAVLLSGSFHNLARTDVGFEPARNLVTVRVPLSGSRYETPEARQAFFEALLERTSAIPGVTRAGAVSRLPFRGGGVTTFHIDGWREKGRVAVRIVGGEYFGTLHIPTLAGRLFRAGDTVEAPKVAVVSRSYAARFEHDVIGQRITLGALEDATWEVVGVVGDVPVAPVDEESPPAIYLDYRQAPDNRMSIVARSDGGLEAFARVMRGIVRDIDPSVPVYAANTLARELSSSSAVFTRRLPMILCVTFALTALGLTLIAVYSQLASEVASRGREIGIRLALGASPAAVMRMILRNALLLTCAGLTLGLAAAALGAPALGSILFGLTAGDWRVYASVIVSVFALVFVATLAPARQAAGIQPASILRE